MSNAIRNIVLVVIALALVSLAGRNFIGAATTTSTAPARHYYLTKTAFNGNQTLTACATGYHFASFAELLDPGVLTYNKTLGRSAGDDGAGPPSNAQAAGWARTGNSSNSTASDNGQPTANCNLWTSGATADIGSYGGFVPPYLNTTFSDVNEYLYVPSVVFGEARCDNSGGFNIGVWCVEN